MSLEKIVDKILDDAHAEARGIIEDSRRKAEGILEEGRKQAEHLASVLIAEAEREGGLEAGRIITQARLEKKIEILAAKRKLIAEVLEQAFRGKGLRGRTLMRTVISKNGEREEPLDHSRLLEEIGPKIENLIVEILKI